MTTLATVIGKGAIGSRPAAASAGRLYFSTEPKTYRDNGSSWDDVSDAGTAGNLTGDVTSVGLATTIGAGKVTEAMQVLANNTTANVSTSKHGYAPILPNDATKYLDGTGAYSVPAGGGGSATFKVPIQDGATGSSSTNSQALTLGSAPTNGNLLILCSENEGAFNISSITQTNVTWTKVAESTASAAPHAEIWKGVVAGSAGTGITVVYSGTTFCGFVVAEFNGITGTLGTSATINSHVTSNHNQILPSITPASSSAMVVVCGAMSTFGNSANVFSTHYTQIAAGAGTGQESYNGYCAAFGFPGAIPTYGVATLIHGGTFSGVIVSLT